jgi:hypothetical protein
VVEGARLESVYTRKGIAGSNPALSARSNQCPGFSRAFLFEADARACSQRMRQTKMGVSDSERALVWSLAPHLRDRRSEAEAIPIYGIAEHRAAARRQSPGLFQNAAEIIHLSEMII